MTLDFPHCKFCHTLRRRISSSTYANKSVPSDVKSKLEREGNVFSLDNFDPTTAQGKSELHKEIKKLVNSVLKEAEQQEIRDKRKTAKLTRIAHSQTFEALDELAEIDWEPPTSTTIETTEVPQDPHSPLNSTINNVKRSSSYWN